MKDLSFAQPEPGLFVVQYKVPEDLNPGLQELLVAAIVAAHNSDGKPTSVVFNIDTAIRGIDMGVPTYWLGVTGRTDTGLLAMAIVTTSAAVRVAAGGFALANTVRGLALEVRTFPTQSVAVDWAKERLKPTEFPGSRR